MLTDPNSKKIFIKNRKSFYVFCNELYAKDIGIAPEEISGKTDYDFFPNELAEKYDCIIEVGVI